MMRSRKPLFGALLLGLSAACFAGLGATAASAHPLGNFSVNHLDTLTFTTNQAINDAVIDTAEIPTAQAASTVDVDGDGVASPAELAAYATSRCNEFNDHVALQVDQAVVAFAVTSSSFSYAVGQAGLNTSRLECRLQATVDFAAAHRVHFEDQFLSDRVGWHEINAVGDGARIVDSPVPQTSVTNHLSNYPLDLLSSPLDVRSAAFDVQPGSGVSTVSGDATSGVLITDTGFFSGAVSRVQETFDDLIGRRELTLSVGLLAIALALVLGASHAVLPGHGKTVMAAYIAGRQGSVRDAVVVGATVTGTHTGGVLVLGTALTLSTSLAGESILGWLGVTSGALVAALGTGLLIAAVRHRRTGVFAHGHSHGYQFGPTHTHTGGDGPSHSHDHDDGHTHGGHAHEHTDGHHHDHGSDLEGVAVPADAEGQSGSTVAVLAATRVTHAVAHSHSHDTTPKVSRRGLVGMGVAGGLVPSPSALIILLSAIALGRTWFGILLVLAYGVGMASTLTAAGVLLVTIRDRYQRRAGRRSTRASNAARRWGLIAPYFTAGLVLVVGVGLAIRSFGQI
jgi:nickel/cobalt transporter (NicO) family protein